MKAFLIANLFIILVQGCGLIIKRDKVKVFIPGAYTRVSQHEFGTEHDTIIINVQNEFSDQYHIERRWKYERILDGEKLKPEYKLFKMTGFYNSHNELLRIEHTGEILSFNPKKKQIVVGSVTYQKK